MRGKIIYIFLESYSVKKMKMTHHAQLNAPRQSSNMEMSCASEVPQSRGKLIFEEVQLLCFCSKIDLARQNLCQSGSIGILKYK